MASNGARIFLTPHDPPGAEGALRLVVSWRPGRRLRVGSRFRSPHTREAGRDARTRPPRAHALRRHRVAHLNSLPSPTELVMLCFLSETNSHVLSSTDLPWPSGRGNDFPASPLGPPDAWSSHRSGWRGPIRSESGRLPPQGGPAALLCGSPGLALCGAQSGKCLLNNVSFKYILRKGLSDDVFQPQEL